MFCIIAVFLAGLMVGRTPEYVGKKIGSPEIKMTILALICVPAATLGFSAVASVVEPESLAGLGNAGPHGYYGSRIAVRFAYEWHDDSGNWFRSYGNENWEFDQYGLMRLRLASINDLPIKEGDRKYHWPLGRRPDGHP